MKIKRIITSAFAAVLLLLPAQKSHAIFLTEIIGAIKDLNQATATNQIVSWMEDVFEFGNEIEALINQVSNTSNILQNARNVYNKISPYLKKAAAYSEVITEMDRLQMDFTQISNAIGTLSTDKTWSVGRVQQYYRILSQAISDVALDVDFVKSILDINNSLSQTERENKLAEMKEKFTRYHNVLNELYANDIKEVSSNYIAAGQDYAMKRTLRLGGNEKLDVAVKINWSDPSLLSNAGSPSRGDQQNGSAKITFTADTYFSIVQMIIGLMMACFMVINWHRRNKGELQHQDALWKVFAGGMASLLILQCIKLCLFDSGIAQL